MFKGSYDIPSPPDLLSNRKENRIFQNHKVLSRSCIQIGDSSSCVRCVLGIFDNECISSCTGILSFVCVSSF